WIKILLPSQTLLLVSLKTLNTFGTVAKYTQDFCYQFETDQVMNWHEAENHCTKEQAHLVSIHCVKRLDAHLTLRLYAAHMPAEAWTGLNDINIENQFVYTDGSPADFLPWAPDQPDNWQNNEDCVGLTSGGLVFELEVEQQVESITFGTMEHPSPLPTGTETNQVQA
uniref:C-type lectin domain-containing protein n=1 Tax=Periophthalmus magnuspinnatus TaxID=409849 RepID=A0A3B3Z717_9GOBI